MIDIYEGLVHDLAASVFRALGEIAIVLSYRAEDIDEVIEDNSLWRTGTGRAAFTRKEVAVMEASQEMLQAASEIVGTLSEGESEASPGTNPPRKLRQRGRRPRQLVRRHVVSGRTRRVLRYRPGDANDPAMDAHRRSLEEEQDDGTQDNPRGWYRKVGVRGAEQRFKQHARRAGVGYQRLDLSDPILSLREIVESLYNTADSAVEVADQIQGVIHDRDKLRLFGQAGQFANIGLQGLEKVLEDALKRTIAHRAARTNPPQDNPRTYSNTNYDVMLTTIEEHQGRRVRKLYVFIDDSLMPVSPEFTTRKAATAWADRKRLRWQVL